MIGIGVFLALSVVLDSEVAGQVEIEEVEAEEVEAEEVEAEEEAAEELEGAEGAINVGSFNKREAVPTEIDALTPMTCPPA